MPKPRWVPESEESTSQSSRKTAGRQNAQQLTEIKKNKNVYWKSVAKKNLKNNTMVKSSQSQTTSHPCS